MKSFTKMLILILAIFGIAKGETLAQYAQVIFPEMSHQDVSVSCNIVLKAIAPYEFRLDRIDQMDGIGRNDVVYYERRGEEIYGIVGTVGVRRSDPTNSNNPENTIPDNFAWASEFNDTLLVLSFLSPLSHSQVYDIVINNLKLYNTQTNTTVTQNAILSEYFTTIKAPLRFVKTNLGNGFVNCNKTIEVEFNDDLSDIDINSLIQIKSSDPPAQAYTDVNFSYTLTNNNTTISIAPFPMDVNLLYTLFVNEEIITGEANDNKDYEFVRENVAFIKTSSFYCPHNQKELVKFDNPTLYPNGNNSVTIMIEDKPKQLNTKPNLTVYDSTENRYIELEFVRWESDIESYNDIKLNYINVNLTCADIDEHSISAIYREPPLDTVVVRYQRNNGKLIFNGFQSQINDSTFTVKKNSLCSIRKIDSEGRFVNTLWEISPKEYIQSSDCAEMSSNSHLVFKTINSSLPRFGVDTERERGIRITIGEGNDFHPDLCENLNFKLHIKQDETYYVDKTFFYDANNMTILINGELVNWKTGNIGYTVASKNYPAGSELDIEIIINNPHHFIYFKGEQTRHVKYKIKLPYLTSSDCSVTEVFVLGRYIRKVSYSWIVKNDKDLEEPFDESDFQLNCEIHNQSSNTFHSSETSEAVTYLNNTDLVTKVTKTITVLSGSTVIITPTFRQTTGTITRFLHQWICPKYDCETIDDATHKHTFADIQKDKKCLYEFKTSGFRLLYIEIDDPNDRNGFISVPPNSNNNKVNSRYYLSGMNTIAKDYPTDDIEILKSVGRDPDSLRASMHTSTVRLYFNKPFDINSIYDGGLIFSDNFKRYDRDNRGYRVAKQNYKLSDYNKESEDCFDAHSIGFYIQDSGTGVELCHNSGFTINVTSGIKSLDGQPLSNPKSYSVRTKGPVWYINLKKIICKDKNEPGRNQLAYNYGYRLFQFDENFNIFDKKYQILRFPQAQRCVEFFENYEFNVNSFYEFATRMNYDSKVDLGGVAYELDRGDIGTEIFAITSKTLTTIAATSPKVELVVLASLASILSEYAKKSAWNNDDYMDSHQFLFQQINDWGTTKHGFYKVNDFYLNNLNQINTIYEISTQGH